MSLQPLQFIAQDGDFVPQRANLFFQFCDDSFCLLAGTLLAFSKFRDDSFCLLAGTLLALAGALLALAAAFFA